MTRLRIGRRIGEGEDVLNWDVGKAIDEIHDKARKAGLFEPEYSGKM